LSLGQPRRRDSTLGLAIAAAQAQPAEPLPEVLQFVIEPRTPEGKPLLLSPKDVDVAPSGEVFVLDAPFRVHRLTGVGRLHRILGRIRSRTRPDDEPRRDRGGAGDLAGRGRRVRGGDQHVDRPPLPAGRPVRRSARRHRPHVPREVVAAANGALVEGDPVTGSGLDAEGLRVFRWRQDLPIPT